MRNQDIVIISTQDFDDLQTRKQRWARHLARHNRVLYVESQMHWITLLRTWPEHRNRLRRCGKTPRQIEPNLWLWTPPVLLPCFQIWRFLARLNNRILAPRLRNVIRSLGFRIDWLWLYTPYSADLSDRLTPRHVVYECVDDFTAARGLIRAGEVRKLEAETLSRSGLVLVTSRPLFDRLHTQHRNVRLSPNACDVSLFESAEEERSEIPNAIQSLSRPVFGFVGAIAYWVDLELLAALARARPEASVVLVGPVRVDIRKYRSIPNLVFTGRRPAEHIPGIIRGFDVCLNPYKSDDLSLGASPLKLYEYLASGKPIVSTDMPEARRFADVVRIAASPKEFIRQCDSALCETAIEAEHRRSAQRELAAHQTWDARFAEIESWLESTGNPPTRLASRATLTLRRGAERKRHVLINGLQVTRPELGGGFTYLTELLRALAEARPDTLFTLITTRQAAPFFDWGRHNVMVHCLPDWCAIGPIRILYERLLSGRLIRRFVPDVYFLPYGALPRRQQCPQVVTYQNSYFLHAGEFAGWSSPNLFSRVYERVRIRALRRMLTHDLRAADRILTVSQTARRDLEDILMLPGDTIDVSYEGVNGPAWSTKDTADNARILARLGISRPYFLSVGALAPNKNLPALVDAHAKTLCEGAGDASLVLAGPDWNGFSKVIEQRAHERGVAHHLRRIGFVPAPALAVLYRNAVAAVQLSGCESFGLPVVEAMAAGCPVICADRSGAAEIGAGAAVLVDAQDTGTVSENMLRMLNEPGWRVQWIRRGRNRAAEFSWAKTAEVTYGALARAAGWAPSEEMVTRSLKRTAPTKPRTALLEKV